MAVYTEVSEVEAGALMRALGLGQLTSLRGIEGGIENTNYFASTDQGVGSRGELAAEKITTYVSPFGCPKGVEKAPSTMDAPKNSAEHTATPSAMTSTASVNRSLAPVRAT